MYIRKGTIMLVAAFGAYGLFELGCMGWFAVQPVIQKYKDKKEGIV